MVCYVSEKREREEVSAAPTFPASMQKERPGRLMGQPCVKVRIYTQENALAPINRASRIDVIAERRSKQRTLVLVVNVVVALNVGCVCVCICSNTSRTMCVQAGCSYVCAYGV
jgi:hypothetical protein